MRRDTQLIALALLGALLAPGTARADDQTKQFECHKTASKAYLAKEYEAASTKARACFLEHKDPGLAHLWLEATVYAKGDREEPCSYILEKREELTALEREQVGGWCKETKSIQKFHFGDNVQRDKNITTNNFYGAYKQKPQQKVMWWVGMGFLAAGVVTGIMGGQQIWRAEDLVVQAQALDRSAPGFVNERDGLRSQHEQAVSGAWTYGGATGLGLLLGVVSLTFAQWEFD